MLANTAPLVPPHVPEVRLRLAHEAHDLWLKTEGELEAIGLPPPFWAFAWAGGQGLARHLLDHPHLVSGRGVVDLASGSGLVAIAAMKAGATKAEAWDIDPFAREAAELNADDNGVRLLSICEDRIGWSIEADVLTAGDVFYDRSFAERLTPWFDRLASEGLTILVGDPGRAYLPKAHVEPLATYEVPVTRALEDTEIKRTTVWQWRAGGPAKQ